MMTTQAAPATSGVGVSARGDVAAYAALAVDLEELRLVPDLRRPPHRRHRAASVSGAVGDRSTDPGSILAGLVGVLARHTRQTDIALLRERVTAGALTGAALGGGDRSIPRVDVRGDRSILRVDVSGDPCFAELTTRTETALGYADRYAHIPLDEVLPPPDGGTQGPPVGSVVVRLVDGPVTGGADPPPEKIEADLVVSLSTVAGGGLRIDYATELFFPERMARLLDHIGNLTAGGVDDPCTPLSRLPMVGAAERERLLGLGRGPVRPVPDWPIHVRVVDQSRRTPDAVAGVQGDRSMSYAELDRRSAALAGHLAGLGVRPGDVVSIVLERDLMTLVATLAVLRTGAAYTPMDPSFPAARMELLLADNGARVVLTTAAVAPRIPAPDGVTVVALDESWPQIEAHPPIGAVDVPTTAPAFVIYTSGSTGTPKGVVLTHDKLTNCLAWMIDECGLGPGARMLHCCSPVFDVALGEIYSALTSGGCVVVASRDDLLDGRRLTTLINRDGVTHAFCPPTNLAPVEPAACPGMRCVVLAGEMVPPEMALRWTAAGTRVLNGYGPAEAAVVCTWYDTAAGWPGQYVPIGRPMPNRVLRVLDEAGGLAPIGVPGEIVIAGFGVAEGYLKRPGLTAERFGTDPEGGTRAYRTGDLGRWNADGALEIMGRMDTQVKVDGIRIEPGEVEAVLGRHEDVGAAVVIRREDGGVARLVGYVVARHGRRPHTTALRDHVARQLPASMVPAAFVVLDRFPVGGTGKIDRRALPAPGSQRPDLDVEYRAAAGEEEKLVVEVFRGVLGIDRIGARDSFFELGGTSLSAAMVATRLDEAADVPVPASQVHRTPTPEGLARWLAAAPRRRAPVSVAALPVAAGPAAAAGPIPLSPSIVKCIHSPFEMVCPVTWWVEGELNIGALVAALGDLHRRHQALHVRYRRTETPVGLLPANPGRPELRLLADAPDGRTALDQLADAVQQPVDFTQGKIWRAALIRDTSTGRTLFGVGIHHIAFDEWSHSILVRDLSRAYAARVVDSTPQWDAPATTLAEAAAEFDRLAAGVTDLDAQRAYWIEQLRSLPRQGAGQHEVPLDVAVAWGPRAGHFVPLSRDLLAGWERAAQTHKISRSSYLVASFVSALRAMTGQDDVALLMTVAKRGSRVLDNAFTTRLNLNCVRVRPESDGNLLGAVHATIDDLMRAQDVPFIAVANDPAVGLSSATIASLPTFVFHDNVAPPLELTGCRATEVVEPYAREVPDGLLVEALPDGDGILIRITIRTDQLTLAFAEQLGAHIRGFFEAGPAAALGRQ